MTKQPLLIGLALLTTTVTAVLYWQQQPPAAQIQATDKFLPQLAGQLTAIDRLELSQGSIRLQLQKIDGQWRLPEQTGFPANALYVEQLLKGLSQAKALEAKTQDPARFAALGLDPVSPQSKATLYQLYAQDRLVAEVLAGVTAKTGTGQYLRQPESQQSWLTDAQLPQWSMAGDWLQAPVLALPAAQVQSLHLQLGQQQYQIRQTQAGQFELQNLPAGQMLQNSWILGDLAGLLSGLTVDQVLPAATESLGQAQARYQYLTKTGVQIEVLVFIRGKQYPLTLAVTAQNDAAKKQAEAWQAVVADRVFILPEAKGKAWLPAAADILKAAPAPAPAPAPAAGQSR